MSALNFTLTGIDYSHRYLAERGITDKTALEFGVGFYAGPGLMQYRVPPAFAKSEILFNMHRAAAQVGNTVVVVEGFFDCMKVHQAGVRSVVGLMGAALSESQHHTLLERFHYIILLLDGDPTGRNASATLAQQLRAQCHVRVVLLPDGFQPDQMPATEIVRVLQPPPDDD